MEATPEVIYAETPPAPIRYATFGYRLMAALIDTALFQIINFPVKIYEGEHFSITMLPTILGLIMIAYKPFMEYRYGATLGKLALRLYVVNKDYNRAGLKDILLRNIFNIGTWLGLTIINYIIDLDPLEKKILALPKHSHYDGPIPGGLIVLIAFGIASLVLFAIDALFLINDKKAQSMHDRIGGTYVIRESK